MTSPRYPRPELVSFLVSLGLIAAATAILCLTHWVIGFCRDRNERS
jgi:hypothetical protein